MVDGAQVSLCSVFLHVGQLCTKKTYTAAVGKKQEGNVGTCGLL